MKRFSLPLIQSPFRNLIFAVACVAWLAGPFSAQRTLGAPQDYDEDDMGDMMEEDFMEDDYDDMDMDMEMEMDMYGSGSAGPPASDAVRTYAENLISLMGEINLDPLFASPASPLDVGPVLRNEAEKAYQSGNQRLALELLFGHMVAEYKDAASQLNSVKYSSVLKRPVWTVRWGVSMAVRGETDVEDPEPIREGATPMRSAGGGFDGGFGDMEMEMEMEMGMEDEMMEDDMEMDMEMDEEMMADMMGDDFGPRSRRTPVPEVPQVIERKMLDESAGEMMDEYLGLVAEIVAEQFAERYQSGAFGPALHSVAAQDGPIPMSDGLSDALAESEDKTLWKPGLVYLGQVDSYKDAALAAREAGIDLVLHFEVGIKQGRNIGVQNISRCRLLSATRGKSAVISKAMDSFEASKFASVGRMDEREYVETQLANLFAIVDRVKVSAMPRLTPGMARARVTQLVSSPNAQSLRTLAEIRLYQMQGLIDDAEAEAAFDIVGGSQALVMMHGPRDERIEMARKWAATRP